MHTVRAALVYPALQGQGRGCMGTAAPDVLHSHQPGSSGWAQQEKPCAMIQVCAQVLQERGTQKLLASKLNKHQKTAKNISVNNSVTLTNYLVFDTRRVSNFNSREISQKEGLVVKLCPFQNGEQDPLWSPRHSAAFPWFTAFPVCAQP